MVVVNMVLELVKEHPVPQCQEDMECVHHFAFSVNNQPNTLSLNILHKDSKKTTLCLRKPSLWNFNITKPVPRRAPPLQIQLFRIWLYQRKVCMQHYNLCHWWRWQCCCRQGQYVNGWSLNRSMVAAKMALLQLIHFMLIYHQYEHSSSTTWSFHVVALVNNFEIMGQREVPEQSHQWEDLPANFWSKSKIARWFWTFTYNIFRNWITKHR